MRARRRDAETRKRPITARVYAWPPAWRLLVDADLDGQFVVFRQDRQDAFDRFLPRSFPPQSTFGPQQAALDRWARIRGLVIGGEEQVCRVCGCRNNAACCDEKTGETCHWVEPDLCSACAEGEKGVRS